jgi:hypothetical protein
LLPFLDATNQISIGSQVIEAIQEKFAESDVMQKQQFIIALRLQLGLDEFLPQLLQFAKPMGLTVDELVGAYVTVYPPGIVFDVRQPELVIKTLSKMLRAAEEAIMQGDRPARLLFSLFEEPWSSDPKIVIQARQLLELILERYSEIPKPLWTRVSSNLFLKLLAYDAQVKQVAPRLFTTLSQTELLNLSPVLFRTVRKEISPEYLSTLKSILEHEEEVVRVGAALLLKGLIDSIVHYPGTRKAEFSYLKNICIDSSLGMKLIDDANSEHRLVGIALLTLSDYPVEDAKYRNLICENLKNPQTDEEESAWNQLLKKISMDDKHPMWRKLLEGILGKPSFYRSSVLSVAMERYQKITSNAEVTIPVIE